MGFGFWVLDFGFGFWILGFGFWGSGAPAPGASKVDFWRRPSRPLEAAGGPGQPLKGLGGLGGLGGRASQNIINSRK